MFETFVFNLGGGVREEMLDGRLYLVAPCVMGVEGVLHGSNGPGFYPAKEWENGAPSWNMKPITNDHPTKDGKPSSAADPTVIANSQLGFLLRTKYDNKLRTEAWFDSQNTQKRCVAVYNALRAGKMLEVSTGLIVDQDKTPGEFKGRRYDWVARNHRPDHLAVLPGKIGACSIADGAGVLANEAATLENLMVANESLLKLIPSKETDVEKKTLVDQLIANKDGLWSEQNREWLMGRELDWLQKAVKPPTVNSPPPPPAPTPPAPVPTTVQEWLVASKAPPEVVYAVNSSITAANAQKAQLVDNIMALPGNAFTKEWLMAQQLEALVGIEKIGKANAPVPAPVTGNGAYSILQPNFVGNAGHPHATATGNPTTMPPLSAVGLTFNSPNGSKK